METKTSKYLIKATKLFGSRFDYSKTVYRDSREKLTVICREHGEFSIVASEHIRVRDGEPLMTGGCKKCKATLSSRSLTMSTATFLERADIVHKGKYNYSRVKYTHSHDHVVVGCPIHGEFHLEASSHLSGVGCAKCAKNWRAKDLNEAATLYYFKVKDSYKIGITIRKNGVEGRYKKYEYRTFSHIKEWVMPRHTAFKIEQELLIKYEANRQPDYSLNMSSGHTELFNCDVLTREDIKYIEEATYGLNE